MRSLPRGGRCGRRGGSRRRPAGWPRPPARPQPVDEAVDEPAAERPATTACSHREPSALLVAPMIQAIGDVGRRRAERRRWTSRTRPAIGRQHDVVGMEVEVQDAVRRTEAGRHTGRRQVTDRDGGQTADAARPTCRRGGRPATGALEVVEHRDAVAAAPSRGPHRRRRTPRGPGSPCARRWRITAASRSMTPGGGRSAVAPQHPPAAEVVDVGRPPGADQRAGSATSPVHASRSSADIVLMTLSIGTSRSAARSQPCGLPLQLAGGVGVGVDREPAVVADRPGRAAPAAGRAARDGS